MKNGFYMGYDASALKEQELLAQAENLLNLGFYSAGYDVLRLGDASRFENAEALGAKLRSVGSSWISPFPAPPPRRKPKRW